MSDKQQATSSEPKATNELMWVEDGKERPFSPAEAQATSWLDELENMPAEKSVLEARRAARKASQGEQDDGLTWI